MKKLLSYNKATGVKEIFHYDEQTDTSVIETVQDVEIAIEQTKRLAQDGNYTKKGMKEGWLHYAHIPDSIIMQLRINHGVNVFDPNHLKKAYHIIDRDYPVLKTTLMKHAPKGA